MEFINKITGYVIGAAVVLVLLTILVVVVIVLVRRNGTKKLRGESENYRNYDMEDSKNFIPIDDIRDDMIFFNDVRPVFVAVLKTRGSDIYKESIGEVVRVKNNYTSFIQALTSPITYRQHGEDINMAHTMKRYQQAYEARLNETYQMTEEYKALKQEFDTIRGSGNPNEVEMGNYLLKLQKKIEAYNWRILHLESQMHYIERVSGPAADSQKEIKVYVVDWEDSGGILGSNLTGEELRKKAAVELKKKCNSMINQLASANTTAVRCTTAELIDMCRILCNPLSGNRYNMQDIQDSSFEEMIVTTSGIDKYEDEFNEELVDNFLSEKEG